MRDSHTLVVPNRVEEIRTIEAMLSEFAERRGLPPEVLFQVRLSLEEVFTNVVSYAHDDGQRHEVEIIISGDDKIVTVEVVDDGRPFNPLRDARPVDNESPLEERGIGGVGIELAKQMMTELRYQRNDGHNRLVMTKKIQ